MMRSKIISLNLFFSIAKHILSFYKLITDEIIKKGNNSMYEILQNVFENIMFIWDKEIIQKGQELTRFYAV